MRVRHAIILVLLFYLWVAGSKTFNFSMDHGGAKNYISYNHVAEALIAGKAELLIKPNPRLETLNDPYEPRERGSLGWHDASYYKGKYYSYFGVVPAAILYAPFKFLTGGSIPDRFASVFFMFGSFFFSILILLNVKNYYFPKVERWKLIVSTLVLGIANAAPYIVREDNGIYHVAIAGALFFVMGMIYFFSKSLKESLPQIKFIVLGSLFLGLAAGCRPGAIPCAIILPLVFLELKKKKLEKEKLVKYFYAVFVPFSICILLLALYNYIRFDNPFDLGGRYQLGVLNCLNSEAFALDNLLPNIYFTFFHPFKFSSTFPYVHMIPLHLPKFLSYPDYYYREFTIGAFYSAPFILLTFFLPLVDKLFLAVKPTSKGFPRLDFTLVMIPGLINVLVLLLVPFVTLRYVADFLQYLLLAACIVWLYYSSKFKENISYSKNLNYVAILLAFVSVFVWSSIGVRMVGEWNKPKYEKVENLFKPVTSLLSNFVSKK